MAHSGGINNRDHNGDMAEQEDGLVYVWLWRSILSQGLLLYYTWHWLLENHTVLHCDVNLEPSCACLRHNWLQHAVELALSVPVLHVYVWDRQNWFPLTELNQRIWQVERVPQQLEVFLCSWRLAVFFSICFTEPVDAAHSVPLLGEWDLKNELLHCFTLNPNP